MVTKSGLLWDTNQKDAIEKGNLIHDMMSQIITEADIDSVMADFVNQGIINPDQGFKLKATALKIVKHPKLTTYYTINNIVYNERDIITKEGLVLRPDRVVINDNKEVTIIDYKTGHADIKHQQQLQLYQDVIESMNLTVKNKILVYVNNNVTVKDCLNLFKI